MPIMDLTAAPERRGILERLRTLRREQSTKKKQEAVFPVDNEVILHF